MTDVKVKKIPNSPQCLYFVQRKKRLCRMTVRPGNQYCGEHSPAPKEEEMQGDKRVPCPLDPKHTCFISKLDKHLAICNARQTEQPSYICKNINVVAEDDPPRVPLHTVPRDTLAAVVDKINYLYECYLTDVVEPCEDQEIHPVVLEEYSEPDRTHTSRRQIKQVSSLLWLLEREGLVHKDICYLDLGAGRGRLSYYLHQATQARVLGVERASVRHRRDTKLGPRLKADLAHLCLERAEADACLGIAKHLCGDAMDLAIRAMTREDARSKTRGLVLATCCHHRCRPRGYVAASHLQTLGVTEEDLSIILGVVSWATCGDGYSREVRHKLRDPPHAGNTGDDDIGNTRHDDIGNTHDLDIANTHDLDISNTHDLNIGNTRDVDIGNTQNDDIGNTHDLDIGNTRHDDIGNTRDNNVVNSEDSTINNYDATYKLDRKQREEVGRRAKVLLDWGRALYLRDCGFDARLLYFVHPEVTLENVCIVAK